MVAQSHEAATRHNALLEAGIRIAELERDLEAMAIARNANRLRAERAEDVVKQLEAQITHPAKEVLTLVQQPQNPEDWRKADSDLAERINAGWAVASEIVNTIEIMGKVQHFRIVRFVRTAPIEPATDQPPISAAATPSVTAVDPVAFPPAHPFIGGLWNALYVMGRFAELVQHWPKLAEYAPRVYAIFAAVGCDMTDVKIMKSFRLGHRADEWTIKVIFPNSKQIAPGTRTSLAAAGVRDLVARDGREFIFDLPAAWVGETPRKTITASSMTIMGEGNTAPDDPIARDRANLNAMVTDTEITHQAFHKALINSRLPHDEQDDLLMQSRQIRVGGRIAAQTARIPSYQSRPINSFLTGGK
jgi:hypothetical protein